MTIEVEYVNPVGISAGEWQVQLAKDAVANASSNSPLSAITEVERIIQGETLIVRVPDGKSDATETSIRNAIEGHLPNATHIATREV